MPVIEHTCATCGYTVRSEWPPFGWQRILGKDYCYVHAHLAALKVAPHREPNVVMPVGAKKVWLVTKPGVIGPIAIVRDTYPWDYLDTGWRVRGPFDASLHDHRTGPRCRTHVARTARAPRS